jgi:outer membrane murein-binding lipoprotein Lpp
LHIFLVLYYQAIPFSSLLLPLLHIYYIFSVGSFTYSTSDVSLRSPRPPQTKHTHTHTQHTTQATESDLQHIIDVAVARYNAWVAFDNEMQQLPAMQEKIQTLSNKVDTLCDKIDSLDTALDKLHEMRSTHQLAELEQAKAREIQRFKAARDSEIEKHIEATIQLKEGEKQRQQLEREQALQSAFNSAMSEYKQGIKPVVLRPSDAANDDIADFFTAEAPLADSKKLEEFLENDGDISASQDDDGVDDDASDTSNDTVTNESADGNDKEDGAE